MTIKIEFPADNLNAARHLGAALTALGNASAGGAEVAVESFDAFCEAALSRIAAAFNLEPELLRTVWDGDVVVEEEIVVTKTETVGVSTTQTAGAAADARLDEHGVPFDPAMCGTAAIPFYASGPNAGQWKKLRGVDQATYDTWYAEAKPATQPAGNGEPVNTAGAFQPDDSGAVDPAVPHDAGTLMAWVSGMQGAGRLTQDQVNSAYTQANLVMPDIFPSDANTPDVIAERVGKLYLILSAWV